MSYLLNLFTELAANGKMLVAYAFIQSTLTSFPGIKTAFYTALHDRTSASYIDLAGQVLFALAAIYRAKKVVVAVNAK